MSRTRSTLGPPGATGHTQGWATKRQATYSVLPARSAPTLRPPSPAAGQERCLFLRSSGPPGQVVGPAQGLTGCSSQFHSEQGTQPALFTGDSLAISLPQLLLLPSQKNSPWRQGQVVNQTPWSRRTSPAGVAEENL